MPTIPCYKLTEEDVRHHFSTTMAGRVKAQSPFLREVLQEANAARRKQLFRMADREQINAMSELVLNTLKGNVPISKDTKRRLKPHANTLRHLGRPRVSVKARRNILVNQSGGNFWGPLLRCYRRACGHW